VKVSKPFLSAVLVVIIACVLVGAAVMLLRSALVVREDWNGVHPFQTSTPTLTLFTESRLVDHPFHRAWFGILKTPSVTSASSTKWAPTHQPSSTPIHQP